MCVHENEKEKTRDGLHEMAESTSGKHCLQGMLCRWAVRLTSHFIVSESFESWAVGPASPQFCLHNCISCFIGVLHYQLVHGSIDSLFVPPTKLQDFE